MVGKMSHQVATMIYDSKICSFQFFPLPYELCHDIFLVFSSATPSVEKCPYVTEFSRYPN